MEFRSNRLTLDIPLSNSGCQTYGPGAKACPPEAPIWPTGWLFRVYRLQKRHEPQFSQLVCIWYVHVVKAAPPSVCTVLCIDSSLHVNIFREQFEMVVIYRLLCWIIPVWPTWGHMWPLNSNDFHTSALNRARMLLLSFRLTLYFHIAKHKANVRAWQTLWKELQSKGKKVNSWPKAHGGSSGSYRSLGRSGFAAWSGPVPLTNNALGNGQSLEVRPLS